MEAGARSTLAAGAGSRRTRVAPAARPEVGVADARGHACWPRTTAFARRWRRPMPTPLHRCSRTTPRASGPASAPGSTTTNRLRSAMAEPPTGGDRAFEALALDMARQGRGSQVGLVGERAMQLVSVPLKAPQRIGWLVLGFPIDQALAADMKALSGLDVALLVPQADGSLRSTGVDTARGRDPDAVRGTRRTGHPRWRADAAAPGQPARRRARRAGAAAAIGRQGPGAAAAPAVDAGTDHGGRRGGVRAGQRDHRPPGDHAPACAGACGGPPGPGRLQPALGPCPAARRDRPAGQRLRSDAHQHRRAPGRDP
jgi:hypothetical protein